MNLAETFARLRERDELAFIPYQTAGYPTLDESLANARALAGAGADIIELGVPFSDPMADGPTIQYASQVALAGGVTLTKVLERLAADALPVPVVLMSYLNVLLAYQRDALFGKLRDAGVCGLIVPDLPIEEADDWIAAGREHGIDIVFLLAPNSTERRIAQVAERARGFIYAVARLGTTGARQKLDDELPDMLARIRAATDLPIVAGFGLSSPAHVRALRGRVDGVIVASRLIDAMRHGEDWKQLAADLKAATRRSSCLS